MVWCLTTVSEGAVPTGLPKKERLNRGLKDEKEQEENFKTKGKARCAWGGDGNGDGIVKAKS